MIEDTPESSVAPEGKTVRNLAGFAVAAGALRYHVTNPAQFLKEQQKLCFAWGREQDEAGL
jgi:hypothetical protein